MYLVNFLVICFFEIDSYLVYLCMKLGILLNLSFKLNVIGGKWRVVVWRNV